MITTLGVKPVWLLAVFTLTNWSDYCCVLAFGAKAFFLRMGVVLHDRWQWPSPLSAREPIGSCYPKRVVCK